MLVEIWSDVVCPWCYIGKRRFERALASFEHAAEVDVVWRSFELDPHGPPVRSGSYADRLARKYGTTRDGAQAMIDRMAGTAAAEGVEMRFDIARPGNTFDAHRLLHLALERGVQGTLKERLLAATFTEGAAIGEADVLAGLATDVGLDGEEVRAVLHGDRYAADVRADERRAADLGITTVPFFVIDGALGIAGAQPPDVLRSALEDGWAEAAGHASSS